MNIASDIKAKKNIVSPVENVYNVLYNERVINDKPKLNMKGELIMANKFQIKQWEVEELGNVYQYLEDRFKDLAEKYQQLDELEQDKEWNSETREYDLVWEDEEQTVPKMVKKWGYVTLSEDELSEEKRTKRDVCKDLMKYIEKLI